MRTFYPGLQVVRGALHQNVSSREVGDTRRPEERWNCSYHSLRFVTWECKPRRKGLGPSASSAAGRSHAVHRQTTTYITHDSHMAAAAMGVCHGLRLIPYRCSGQSLPRLEASNAIHSRLPFAAYRERLTKPARALHIPYTRRLLGDAHRLVRAESTKFA